MVSKPDIKANVQSYLPSMKHAMKFTMQVMKFVRRLTLENRLAIKVKVTGLFAEMQSYLNYLIL